MLREIIEFAIGPNDKHVLFLWARCLCKKAIVMIEHPTFAQLHKALTPLQMTTHVYIQCWNDVENMRDSITILEAYKIKMHVAENLLFAAIQCLQDSESNASLIDIVELDILPGSEAMRTDQVQALLSRTSHLGNTA